jgi:predicted lipoprotein with Yx(FWY)xxD motif
MKIKMLFSTLMGLALLLSACGSAAAPTPVGPPSAPATLTVSQNATQGSFLTDSKGMTLYLFTTDTISTSTCYGGCATIWPPLLTSGDPIAGPGVDAAFLGTITRTDGTTQVAYNGWPLYYYQKDHKAGDTTGEGVQGVWFMLTPMGVQK